MTVNAEKDRRDQGKAGMKEVRKNENKTLKPHWLLLPACPLESCVYPSHSSCPSFSVPCSPKGRGGPLPTYSYPRDVLPKRLGPRKPSTATVRDCNPSSLKLISVGVLVRERIKVTKTTECKNHWRWPLQGLCLCSQLGHWPTLLISHCSSCPWGSS